MQALPSQREMQRAYQASDASYDGLFYLGVRTTGIFCRPSCRARKPRPENVEFFATCREALFAGYRPCKRCRPLAFTGRPPAWVERLLGELEKDPTARIQDADLRKRGVDPARARRYFRRSYGMTFQAFARARRLGSALEQIRNGKPLDDVALGNGYDSHSGFREAFTRTFGQTPGRSAAADCIRLTWLESPIGPLLAGATAKGICLLEFTERRMLETQFATLRRRFQCAIVPGMNEHLNRLKGELAEYFGGSRRQFTVPLEYPGSPFQRAVWSELLMIAHGETRSYEDIARRIGSPGASRAVGTANGQNRIAILIPCHRVVNKDGRLGGYGGGLWRKRYLLDLERRSNGRRESKSA
jgi:AraC family transcriptional regulator, regulatory protein of adaptative response / methylated-DNA-[protein]-cysteine methyltransferase